MSIKLVVFDAEYELNSKVFDDIQKIGSWAKLTNTTFLLHTQLTTDQVLTKLLGDVGLDDNLYVLELSPAWSGYGAEKASSFLHEFA